MADLVGSGAVSAAPAAVPRPSAAPAPTSSPSGIRGPRRIMQERAEREARQRAEAERQRMEQVRAEQEAHLLEEARRRAAERRATEATSGGGGVGGGHQDAASQQQSQLDQHQETSSARRIPIHAQQQSTHMTGGAAPPTHRRPTTQTTTATQQQQQQQQQTPSQAYLAQGSTDQRSRQNVRPVESTTQQQPHHQQQAPTEPTKARNSFPHAFERWETLSAHWEGLTSFWIRKLEQNKDEITRDALSQQLARQVTDLSAAGANLFHAVVELQRLRASSERKFQRWFFETRTDLERAQEVKAMLEAALDKEKRERAEAIAEAIRDAVDHERGVSRAQMQLAEMRKELAISKEEARRAWEELGRREQEERDRTYSLQTGHPTIVGGVQVVPMTQGSSQSRHTSTRDPGSYQTEYSRAGGAPEPVQTPPGQRSPPTPESRHHHQQPQSRGGPLDASGVSPPSATEAHFREADFVRDAQGNFLLDTHGNRIPYVAPPSTYSGSEPEHDEYETPATTNPPSGGHEPTSTSSAGQWSGSGHASSQQGQHAQQQQQQHAQQPELQSPSQDYTGEGYGAPGWDVPRHHHPTRLSDVIEEDDERSRTSASQLSRGA